MKKSGNKYATEKRNLNAKPVSEYTLEGEFIKIHDSIYDLVNKDPYKNDKKLLIRNYKRACEGIYQKYRGRIYIYLEDTWLPNDNQRSLYYRLGRRIHQYTLEGKLIASYNSALEASKASKIDKDLIVPCCAKNSNMNASTVKGFIWIYQKDLHYLESKLNQYGYNLKGEYIRN